MVDATNLCRVCDCVLKEDDWHFLKSVGTRGYFHIICSSCGGEYACDETGSIVKFTFAEHGTGDRLVKG